MISVLKDDDLIETYKIKEGHTVHLVKGTVSTSSTSASSATPANPNSTTSSSQIPSNIQSGAGAFNPLSGLTGARYAGQVPLPSASLFGPDGGQSSFPPGPEEMAQMMQQPQFQQAMQSMLQNPQVLDYVIQSQPALRNMGPQVRQMMQSEEFRRALSDPNMMQQMAQMQRMVGGAGGMEGMFGGTPRQGGGNNNFPAPGMTNTTPGQNAATTNNAPATTTPDGPSPTTSNNIFSSLFAPPQEQLPLASSPTNANTNSTTAPNPFAMLFNPQAGGGAGAGAAAPNSAGSVGGQGGGANPGAMYGFLEAMMGMNNAAGGAPRAAPRADDGGGSSNPFWAPPPAQPEDNRAPEDRYQEQLRQLNDMGFHEFERSDF